MRKKSIGHAFSDHVFEEHIKRRKGFSSTTIGSFHRILPIIILFIIFGILFARLFTLQIVRASYYSRLSDENRIRTQLIPAPRGIIFDRNNQALVRNTPAYNILENKKVVWLSNDEALKRITKGDPVISTVKREYLLKDDASHVIGYIGQISGNESLLPEFKDYGLSDFTGRMGLEEQYEKLLHGQNGRQLYEVNAKGERIRLLGEDEPRPGENIYTTLDTNLQKIAAISMKDIERGAVVISDPRDGSVLALYSKPSFDPNLFTREESYVPSGIYKDKETVLMDGKNFPLVNRVISGTYPPGSTFKIITSLAALSAHSITEDTEFEDTGILSIGGSNFGTWNYLETGRKEGLMDVRRALVRSNDIFFYQTALKTGIDTIAKWAGEFNLGKKTGIDLPGEEAGIVPSPSWKEKEVGEQWYLGDTINMSIGQGFLLVSPLQVNLYTQFIANNGTLYKPHLLKNTTEILKRDFISKEDIRIVKDGMKGACERGGTGYPFFDFKVKNSNLKPDGLDYVENASAGASMVNVAVGCKTGTSEAHGYEAVSHAWFTIFAPYYNPEIAVTVLAENAGQGSDIAAPVAKEILTKYFEGKQ